LLKPASEINWLGVFPGLQKVISWPRSRNSRAIGNDRVSNPKSFEGSVVKRNFFIEFSSYRRIAVSLRLKTSSAIAAPPILGFQTKELSTWILSRKEVSEKQQDSIHSN
jgi:hypothetical protein